MVPDAVSAGPTERGEKSLDGHNRFTVQSPDMTAKTRTIADLHETNRQIVFRTIWIAGVISRADLARITRINKTTISAIVASLIDSGFVIERESTEKKVGRQPIELTIAADRHWFFSLDVRTERTVAAIIDMSGLEIAREVIRYSARNPNPRSLVRRIRTAFDRLTSSAGVKPSRFGAVGVNVPGVVDIRSGVVERCPCLGWIGVPIADLMRTGLDTTVPIIVEPNAAAAIRAEIWRGRHLDEATTAVYVAINEEIDTAIVLDGKVLMLAAPRGPGSFGRMVIADQGPSAPNHERESWEDFASVNALFKKCGVAITTDKPTDACIAEIRELAGRGDAKILRALEDEAYWLGVGIANIAVALGFGIIVVGGLMTHVWDYLGNTVESVASARVKRYGTRVPEILIADIPPDGNDAAVLTSLSGFVSFDLLRRLAGKDKEIIESIVLHHTMKKNVRD